MTVTKHQPDSGQHLSALLADAGTATDAIIGMLEEDRDNAQEAFVALYEAIRNVHDAAPVRVAAFDQVLNAQYPQYIVYRDAIIDRATSA